MSKITATQLMLLHNRLNTLAEQIQQINHLSEHMVQEHQAIREIVSSFEVEWNEEELEAQFSAHYSQFEPRLTPATKIIRDAKGAVVQPFAIITQNAEGGLVIDVTESTSSNPVMTYVVRRLISLLAEDEILDALKTFAVQHMFLFKKPEPATELELHIDPSDPDPEGTKAVAFAQQQKEAVLAAKDGTTEVVEELSADK
jgi:hypothetical protein